MFAISALWRDLGLCRARSGCSDDGCGDWRYSNYCVSCLCCSVRRQRWRFGLFLRAPSNLRPRLRRRPRPSQSPNLRPSPKRRRPSRPRLPPLSRPHLRPLPPGAHSRSSLANMERGAPTRPRRAARKFASHWPSRRPQRPIRQTGRAIRSLCSFPHGQPRK